MQFFNRKYIHSLFLVCMEFLIPLEIHVLCFSFLNLFYKGNDLLYTCDIFF